MITRDGFFGGTLPKLCQAAAEGVHRYVEVSGENPADDMPESFVPAFILQTLGSELTMTLETRLRKLCQWNNEAKFRRDKRQGGKAPDLATDAVSLKLAVEKLGFRPRVDLVLYHGHSIEKSRQGFLAIVEFKKHEVVEQDRTKILSILHHIDTCPYGAICSVVDATADSDWMRQEAAAARLAGDCWCVQDVPRLPHHIAREFLVCARAFERPMNV